MVLRRRAMKVPVLDRYRASPRLQAHAALLGGLSCVGAAGGLIGVLGIVSVRQLRKEGGWSANKFAAVALAAALAACAAPAPSWSAAQPCGAPPLGRTSGPALDCSDYDNIFSTPDAVKLPVGACRRP